MNILLTTQRMVVLECWRWSVGVGVLVLECWCWIYTTSYARARVSQGLRLLLLLFCCWVVRIESLGGENTIETERETALDSFLSGLFRWVCTYIIFYITYNYTVSS